MKMIKESLFTLFSLANISLASTNPSNQKQPLSYNEDLFFNATMTNSPNGNIYGALKIGYLNWQRPPNVTAHFNNQNETVNYFNLLYDTAS